MKPGNNAVSALIVSAALTCAPAPGWAGGDAATVTTAACDDMPNLECAVRVENLDVLGGTFNVDLTIGSYASIFAGRLPYFFGDDRGAFEAAQAIQAALNSPANVFGANGVGTQMSRLDVPFEFNSNPWAVSHCSLAENLLPMWRTCESSINPTAILAGPENYVSFAVFEPLTPLPVSGTVEGINSLTAVCDNVSTAQRVTVPMPDPPLEEAFDCTVNGLSVSTGDVLRISIRGAVPGPSQDLKGIVRGYGATSGAACINRTQADQMPAPVVGRSWDCGGLAMAAGDQVSVVFLGIAE